MSGVDISIDFSALAKNYTFLRETVGEFYAVVKCNAYGHGLSDCVKSLSECGCRRFAVAYPYEALLVRRLVPSAEILLLSRANASDISELVDNGIIITVFSEEYACAVKQYKNARVHLKLETGMNRSGLRSEELSKELFGLAESICGAYTHFPRSYDRAATIGSAKLFSDAVGKVECFIGRRITKHAAASFAALSYPEVRFDASRIGIALYGVGDSRLFPVKEVRTRVIHIHTARKGEYVGYGEPFLCTRDTAVATVCGGYADGIMRSGAKRLTARINGFDVRICGCPCMDRTMFDVTPVFENGASVSVGDEVLLFGKDKSVERTAHECGTIAYEVLTNFLS